MFLPIAFWSHGASKLNGHFERISSTLFLQRFRFRRACFRQARGTRAVLPTSELFCAGAFALPPCAPKSHTCPLPHVGVSGNPLIKNTNFIFIVVSFSLTPLEVMSLSVAWIPLPVASQGPSFSASRIEIFTFSFLGPIHSPHPHQRCAILPAACRSFLPPLRARNPKSVSRLQRKVSQGFLVPRSKKFPKQSQNSPPESQSGLFETLEIASRLFSDTFWTLAPESLRKTLSGFWARRGRRLL